MVIPSILTFWRFSWVEALLCVQFVQPVFHVTERTKQGEPGLAQIEPRVERVRKFLPLIDAGQLFGFGCQLRLSAWAASRAVSQFHLSFHRFHLRIGDLLL